MKFVDIRFRCTATSDLRELPPYLGATLRGALGYLLKQTVCQVSHGNCQECLLQPACAYPAVFEGVPPKERDWMRKYPYIPQPFVLVVEPPVDDSVSLQTMNWGVRLFGPACRFWPYVIHVFQLAGQQGIGKSRVKYEIDSIVDGVSGGTILSSAIQTPTAPEQHSIGSESVSLPDSASLRWRFHTPTRLGEKNQRLDGLSLLLAGRRRLQTMTHFYGTPNAHESPERFEADDFQTESFEFHKFGFSRFSGRQKQKMDLKGVMGEIVITGPWNRLGDLLSALPVIHIGKSTSFGFGRTTWELA